MLLKRAFPIIAYTVAILSGIYVANYLLPFRIGSNEQYLPFPPPPLLPSAGISGFISLAMEVGRKRKKKISSLKAGAPFPEFLGEM